jgi:hypothetical protein
MRCSRFLATASTAVALLVVGVGSAAATTVTSPTGTAYTGTIKAVTEGHGVLDNPIAKIECPVTLEGPIESHGVGTTAVGKATGVKIGPCTDDWHVTTVATGQLIAHWTSGYNGTLESTGTTAETTRFGISCRYATSNTKIGTITGGNPAVLHLETMVPFHSGSIFCGSGATRLTGGGTSTPSAIYLDS